MYVTWEPQEHRGARLIDMIYDANVSLIIFILQATHWHPSREYILQNH